MCCLFGLIDYAGIFSASEKNTIISVLSRECEERGTDATGIAYNSYGKLRVFKRPLPAHSMWYRIPSDAKVIMGHTRMTTQGSEKFNFNNHPFVGNAGNTTFALAHNGVLRNDNALRKSEKIPDTFIQTDSYIAVQLIEKENTLSFDTIRKMAEKTEGTFCYTILSNKNETYFVKGDNPMTIYKFNSYYIYASTEDILKRAVAKLHMGNYSRVSINGGDILKIDRHGHIDVQQFNYSLYSPDIDYFNYYKTIYQSDDNDEIIDELVEYAGYFGIDADDIMMLLDYGYDELEIEDMLYEPLQMQKCISELHMMEREMC